MKKRKDDMRAAEAISYLANLGDTLTAKELIFVNAIFYKQRGNYSEEQYLDIIQASLETLYDWREEGITDEELFNKMENNVKVKVPVSVKEGVSIHRIEKDYPLEENLNADKELKEILELFDTGLADKEMNNLTDKTKNEIFLEVIKGIDKNEVATKYSISLENVETIYTERLAIVTSIKSVNGKVYVDGEENYSTKLDNKIADIREKIYG